jgi:protein-S-isoprenylcysteine O-methyltransferase Ste14
MTETRILEAILYGWLGLAAIVAIALRFVPAGYGRHGGAGWGPCLPARAGWMAMEAPAALGMIATFAIGVHPWRVSSWVFLGLWLAHYVNRAFVYPLRMPGAPRPIPLSIVAMGVFFNGANAWLNGRWLFAAGPDRPDAWLADPRFLCGVVVFFAGMAANLHADAVLRRLRRAQGAGYQVPRGGLYRFVSCPNYLGEIVEWSGWALATWSLAGLSFAAWTAANLVPRAMAHHRWYRRTFPDYPSSRKALIPFLW